MAHLSLRKYNLIPHNNKRHYKLMEEINLLRIESLLVHKVNQIRVF
jgi:hypothetical protein